MSNTLPETAAPPAPLLEMRGIVKRFGDALALDRVDFDLRPGEIHALLGENGAGKSTLMNVLRGLLPPTAGEIRLRGIPVRFGSPLEATRAGIGMVHQHFLLVPPFTIAENLTLASATETSFLLDTAPLTAHANATAERLHWSLPPLNTTTSDLPVGTQQRIEILKALMGDAQILLFDEPTAVLAPQEIEELLSVLRKLRAEGRSIVFVSHKLGEVMAVCDRVTVLRRGRNAGVVDIADTSPDDLAQRMVGRTISAVTAEATEAPAEAAGQPTLVAEGLTTRGESGAVPLQDISFTLHPGEILGFAGVDGNGQSELAQALTGLRAWTGGALHLNGKIVKRLRPQDMERYGIALIPPDRHREGLALTMTVAENLILEAACLPQFRRGPFLNHAALRRFAEQTAQDFDIRAENLNIQASSLSGGNQQKIVIARALWRKPSLLVAVSPTRGLDVAATSYVHSRLRERQAQGGAIVLISTELDEVIALSSRIAVLYEGRIAGIVPANTSRETLGLLMGGKGDSAHA